MSDTNECKLSGTIDRLRRINTKSGNPMAEVLLQVRQDKFRVTAFGNLAEHILAGAQAGERLSVTGTLSVSNWKDEASGEWRNSFAVTAWAVEMNGEKISYQRQGTPPQRNCNTTATQQNATATPWNMRCSNGAEDFVAGTDDPF